MSHTPYPTPQSSLMNSDLPAVDYGCIVNGQLVVDRTDPVGGNKGVMMKMYIGVCIAT